MTLGKDDVKAEEKRPEKPHVVPSENAGLKMEAAEKTHAPEQIAGKEKVETGQKVGAEKAKEGIKEEKTEKKASKRESIF